MCGVVGLLIKDPALEPRLGSLLVPMIEALGDRGPDSSGIAVYSDGVPAGGAGPLAAVAGADGAGLARERRARRLAIGPSGPRETVLAGRHRLGVPPGTARGRPDSGAPPTIEVHPARNGRRCGCWRRARRSRSSRTPGGQRRPAAGYGLSEWQGYLAVAHTRMATESAVTVLHSHPFVPAADLCVVHNGSFSNYASVRRRLSSQGVRFDSDNDSEVAARFLAERLAAGDDLAEATRWVMKEIDGFFTLVITTATACPSCATPLPASPPSWPRPRATSPWPRSTGPWPHLPGIAEPDVFEPQPEEVYTWTRSSCDAISTLREVNLRLALARRRRVGPCDQPRRSPQPGRRARAGHLDHRGGQRRLLRRWPVRIGGGHRSRHRRSTASSGGRSARTSWAEPIRVRGSASQSAGSSATAGSSSSKATPRCAPASRSRAGRSPSPATPGP